MELKSSAFANGAEIPRRHTCRLPFERATVDKRVLEHIVAAVQTEGAWVHVVKDRRERHATREGAPGGAD